MIPNLPSNPDRDLLIQLLEDPDLKMRLEAIDLLGDLADELAVEPLVEILKSTHWMHREHAALALSKIGDAGPLALLKSATNRGNSEIIREAAEFGMKQLKNKKILEPYFYQLKNTEFEIRTEAAGILSHCGKPGLELLISALENPDPNVRDAGVYGLMVTHDAEDEVTEPLIRTLLTEPESTIRGHAANALRLAGDERAYQPLMLALQNDPAPRVRYHAIRALYEGSADESEHLFRQALIDEDAEVREQAAAFVGEPGNYEVLEPLVKLLQDPVEGVRMAAAYSLGKIGDDRAIEVLLSHLYDESDYVRANVIRALGVLKAQQALPKIKNIEQSDTNQFIRKAAFEAITFMEQK